MWFTYIYVCVPHINNIHVCVCIEIYTYIKNMYIVVFSVHQSGKLATIELVLLDERKKKLKVLEIARQNGKSFQKTTQM